MFNLSDTEPSKLKNSYRGIYVNKEDTEAEVTKQGCNFLMMTYRK